MQVLIDDVNTQPLFSDQVYLSSSELKIAELLNGLVTVDITLSLGQFSLQAADVSLLQFYNELTQASVNALLLKRRASVLLGGEPFFWLGPGDDWQGLILCRFNASHSKQDSIFVEVKTLGRWLLHCEYILGKALASRLIEIKAMYGKRPTAPVFSLMSIIERGDNSVPR